METNLRRIACEQLTAASNLLGLVTLNLMGSSCHNVRTLEPPCGRVLLMSNRASYQQPALAGQTNGELD